MRYNKSMEQRNIRLPNGKILEVEFKSGFLDKIRESFCLTSDENVTDEHIRMFFYGSLKTAVNKKDKLLTP
jgi:hypothetical protein